MLKILCQFASERKKVHANFFFTELAFVLAKFSLLRLKKKQRNLPYVFVFKKVGDKKLGCPSCSASNYFADAGFEDYFLKKHFLYLLYSAMQKTFVLAASFDISATWSQQKLKKRGCIPRLKWLENVKLQPSHYFIIMDLSKLRGIICMQFNFYRRAMR